MVAVLIAASLSLEMTLLAGVYTVSDGAYHGIHLALMGALIASQIALYATHKHRYALWFAIALTSTMVGDFINSQVSDVEPVTTKLTWALLFFGVGYTIYCAVLWHHGRGAGYRGDRGRDCGKSPMTP